VRNKSYLISLSVEAMCMGRVNVMNRANQGRLRNFKAYTGGLQRTIADLLAIRDADAVSKWLRYRMGRKETGLSKYFNLEEADYQLCLARTVTFVNALSDTLETRMPHAKVLDRFDIFDDSCKLPQAEKIESLECLYDTFLRVCCIFLPWVCAYVDVL
jgi:hypothetical protein